MQILRLSCLLISIFLATCMYVAVGQCIGPYPIDLCPAAKQLLARHSKIDAIHVRIISTHSTTKAIVHYEFAASGKSRFVSLWHDQFHASYEDPDCIFQYLHDGEFNFYNPYRKWFETTSRFAVRPYTDKVTMEMYSEAIGWWPAGDTSEKPKLPGDRPFFITDFFSNPGCRFSREITVDSMACSLYCIKDTSNVVVDNAGRLLKREFFSPDGNLIGTISLSDYRTVDCEIELPFRIHRYFPGKLESKQEVVFCVVNDDVDPSVFEFRPPPGCFVVNRDSSIATSVAEPFSEAEKKLDRLVNSIDSGKTNSSNKLIVGFAILILAIATAFVAIPVISPNLVRKAE